MEILATTLISVENFEDGNVTREINSPRSLESCLRSGFDPSELHPKSFDRLGSKNLPQEMVDMKHHYFEKKRRGKILPRRKALLELLACRIAHLITTLIDVLLNLINREDYDCESRAELHHSVLRQTQSND
jgi:hypothetical protein